MALLCGLRDRDLLAGKAFQERDGLACVWQVGERRLRGRRVVLAEQLGTELWTLGGPLARNAGPAVFPSSPSKQPEPGSSRLGHHAI